MNLISLAESGLLPDSLVRCGIRRLLRQRARSAESLSDEQQAEQVRRFAQELRNSPLAVATEAANQQHYELPAEFFQMILGPRFKYSSCLYEASGSTLANAEESMLRLTCQRAGVHNGMSVLELGCGWGSLTLWIAEKHPDSRITAVSNSAVQKRFIESRALQQRLTNLRVITADMRDFDATERYDRVVSVEMFEHMRNYEMLLDRVASWLTPEGRAFVHVFCHRDSPYLFQTQGASDWMARHFFTGGMMPSEDLFDQFGRSLKVTQRWRVDGRHYWRTCEDWLKNLDRRRGDVLSLFRQQMSAPEARVTLQRWRMFFMACAELFRYRGGSEWFVSQYLFDRSIQKNAVGGAQRLQTTEG